MRIKQPKPFEPGKEYAQGERAKYGSEQIVCRKYNDKLKTVKRCALCVIRAEDCPPQGLKCTKTERKDNKNVYYARYKKQSI